MQYPVRTVHSLFGYRTSPVELSAYGGNRTRRASDVSGVSKPGAGFFSVKKVKGRWWLVDPSGYLFIHQGVASIAPGKSPRSLKARQATFGGNSEWAAATTRLLKKAGFNGAGAWSHVQSLRRAPSPLVYTQIWDFMSTYGRKRGGTYQKPGHTGYPQDCIFVFDPEFEAFCNRYAQQLQKTKNDPYLLGHFSDNELPFPIDLLQRYLSLPSGDPGYKAARAWLAQRKVKNVASVTGEDQQAFLQYVAARYFRITARAIKKYDPNHLFLGARLHDNEINHPAVFKAASAYVDVLSVNYYRVWSPDIELMKKWESWSGKPILITEWYVKGADAGLANQSGAGWIVKTQADRGRFYQHFALALLESKVCVGWHWFKYMDNDPQDLSADPSNRDANKGLVNIFYVPYQPLIESMRELNQQTYSLIDYFDSK
jgi:hypothetical protein